jgi:hypothetical protein
MLTQNSQLTDFICFNSANTDDLTLIYDLPEGVTQVSTACVGAGGGNGGSLAGGGGGGVAVLDNYPVIAGDSLRLVLPAGRVRGSTPFTTVNVVREGSSSPFVIAFPGGAATSNSAPGSGGSVGETAFAPPQGVGYQGGAGGSGE